MRRDDWKSTAELIGIAAIVASLVFVGLQMRQTEVIARATLYQMRSDSGREIVGMALENRDIFADVNQTNLSPNTREFRELGMWWLALLNHYENSHHLYQLGFLSAEQWASDRRQLGDLIENPNMRKYWEDSTDTFRESFAAEMASIIAEYAKD